MPYRIVRRKGSENLWLDIKIKGRKRIRRSAGTPDRRTAEALAKKLEAQEWQRVIHGERHSLTFSEAVMDYVADGYSAAYLDKLVAHFRDKRVVDIAAGHIRAAGRVLYPNAKPATWNRQVITPARAVINHAASKEMAAHIKVEMFAELKPVRPVAGDDWLPRFMAKASPKLAALALFMRITGARIGQATAMTWKAIDLASATAVIPPAKGHSERLADLTPQMVASLANLPGDRVGRVFGYMGKDGVYKQWRAVCRAANIPYITSHLTGRRGFFTAMARKGIDAKTAGVHGGLSSSRLVIEVYTEARTDRGLITDVFGTIESQPATAEINSPEKNKKKLA